jgi:hypothetical protein
VSLFVVGLVAWLIMNKKKSGSRRASVCVSNPSRFELSAKYCAGTKPTVEDRGSPTLRFGKALNFSLLFCVRHLVAQPATLHIILKNDAKSSFFKLCCNMLGQCLHVSLNQSDLTFSPLRIREIL